MNDKGSYGSDSARKPRIKFPSPVLRIRIQVDKAGQWTVVKRVEIPSMTLSRSVDLPERRRGQGLSGFWVEAVDRQGQLLYRTLVRSPFERSVEIFDADGEPHRIEPPNDEILFDVLVPNLPDLAEIIFYSDVDEQGRSLPKSSAIQRVPVRGSGGKGGERGRK
jgi:hypothetical protein